MGQSIAESVSNANDTGFKGFLTNSVSQSITLVPPNPNELYNTINSLHSNKSCGHDEISPHFLRLGCEILAPILFLLFSYVFDLGFFPQIFKTAKVIPIFKNGDKQQIKNYCPISILSSLFKILENLIKARFVNFFEKHEVLYDYQYCFRKK